MRGRRIVVFTALAALALGFVFAAEWGQAQESRQPQESRQGASRQTESQGATAGSDCGFLRDPDVYLGSAGRRLEAASRVTDQISTQIHRGQSDFVAYEEVPYRNFIDQFLFDKMRADRIPHAGLTDDATFQRRVMLDLTGRIPTPNEVRSFLMDSSADKRDRLVNQLMDSPEFVDRWTLFFGDLYKNTDQNAAINRTYDGRNAFHRWLRQAITDRWPYNEMVTAILTANGSTFDTGPANWTPGAFAPMGPTQDTYDSLAAAASAQFLGITAMDCVLCHDGAGHLSQLNLWGSRATRMQTWQMASYFSRTNYNGRGLPANAAGNTPYVVSERTTGNYTLNTNSGNRPNRTPTGGVNNVNPRYMFSNATATGNFRQGLAQALTSDPQFGRATVNYLWAELMGLGIVDPPDQFDPARLDPDNPPPAPWTLQPSNPELLEALAGDFRNSGYDLRHTIRQIVTSSAYQLSSRFPGTWKATYTPYFARHIVRRLKAEEVHDAVLRAAGTTVSYTLRGFDQPITRAMQLPDVREPNGARAALPILDNFLRGNRDNVARSGDVTITQTLTMMNDLFVINGVRSTAPTSMVRTLLTAGRTNPQMVDELYLSALSRYPTPQEKEAALNRYAGTVTVDQRSAASEDLLWVLLNRVDFWFNY